VKGKEDVHLLGLLKYAYRLSCLISIFLPFPRMSVPVSSHGNDDLKVPTVQVSNPSSLSGQHDSESCKDNDTPEKPYSVFSLREKWFLVGVASFSALFR